VCHDAGELGFIRGGGNGPEVDKQLSSGNGKRVDLLLRDYMKLKRPGVLLRYGSDQLLAKLPNVLWIPSSARPSPQQGLVPHV